MAAPVARAEGSRRELHDVMGCRASITVVGGRRGLAAAAEVRLRDLDLRWSRFRADSEVMQLARHSGATVHVSQETILLVERLIAAWEVTDGAFDPTLLPDLVGLGYAGSVQDPTRVTELPSGSRSSVQVDEIEIDAATGSVLLPVGATLDPGGLGKGLAADLVVDELVADGAEGAMVEIGGDLRVSGESPSHDGWRIDVEDPYGGPPLGVVSITDGGVATSSVLKRRWTQNGATVHHLIDPRTGHSTSADVVAATVVAGTAAWAEAFSKAPVVLGVAGCRPLLAAYALPALLICDLTRIVATPEWQEVVA